MVAPAREAVHGGQVETSTGLALGAKLGQHQIIGTLGEGGMGKVYRALDTRLDRAVAIKISSERFSQRFEREARAFSALNHPLICNALRRRVIALRVELHGDGTGGRRDFARLAQTCA